MCKFEGHTIFLREISSRGAIVQKVLFLYTNLLNPFYSHHANDHLEHIVTLARVSFGCGILLVFVYFAQCKFRVAKSYALLGLPRRCKNWSFGACMVAWCFVRVVLLV